MLPHNRNKISLNINQDEAAVLGACFRGAGISKQFKVKDIRIKEFVSSQIEIVYNAEPKGEPAHPVKSEASNILTIDLKLDLPLVPFALLCTVSMVSWARRS
jgi:molecular chaperone DnaK (HSP70)